MKQTLIFLSFLLLCFPFSGESAQTRGISRVVLQIPNGEKIQLYSQSHALVIGVSKYQDSAWGQLDSVPRDVREVKKALEGQGFNVETILNPTKQGMNDRIEQFIVDYGFEKNNRLLFYYSGHGYTQERNGRQFGYLVPSDAPNPLTDEKGFFGKSIKMTRILSWAKEIESKHALFVFDSCFSGSVLRSRALSVPEDISYSTSKPVRQFISAGSADQPVPSESVFRPLFIRGINGKADLDGDGYVTGNELGMYLQKEVPTYESGQTPQYGKIRDPYLDEGNFVFLVPDRKTVSGSGKQKVVEEKERGVLYYSEVDGNLKWNKSGDKKKDGKYVGEIENGSPNGQGTLTLNDIEKYVGEWKDGLPNGQGTGTYDGGKKYVGEWKDGREHGQGTWTYFDGDKYVGEYYYGVMTGQGTFTYANGDKFVGEFKDGVSWNGTQYDKDRKITGKYVNGNFKGSDSRNNWVENKRIKNWGFDGLYTGETENGIPNGQGRFVFKDSRYSKDGELKGHFQDGKLNGQGESNYPDGGSYAGGHKNNYTHGFGTYTYASGNKYVGEFKDNKRSGQGTYTNVNGDKFVGEYKDGKRNGQGTLTFADGDKFVGEYKDGNMNGQGTLTFADGDKYVGEYKDNKKNGQFTVTYVDGGKFVGEFKDDKKNGQGTLTFEDGEKFVGEYKDNKRNGQGTYTYANGNKYVGEFKDGKKSGQGTETFVSGDKFVGEYKDNKRNGQFTVTYADGGKYVGEYKDDLRNGQGTFSFADGDKYVGEFKDDERNGQGTLIFPDGTKGIGEFREGRPWNITHRDKNGKIIVKFVNGKMIEQ